MQTTYERPSNLLLWFSILAAPFAWSAHLSIEYFLTTAECQLSAGNMAPLMAASTAGLFALAFAGLFAGVVALRANERHPQPDAKVVGRKHFMALAGILLSVLFIAGLVMATIPILFLEPCHHGP